MRRRKQLDDEGLKKKKRHVDELLRRKRDYAWRDCAWKRKPG